MIEPYYAADRVTLYLGDCIEVMRLMPDASVGAIVTDPPYELGFMGKHWDGTGIAYSVEMWAEALRVLKPGGHLAAFGGTRTYHRMACAIEDAGFEVRDCLAYMYGSGFPKSLDVSKAIDRAAGAEREISGYESRHINRPVTALWDKSAALRDGYGLPTVEQGGGLFPVTAPATDAARQWEGWGTALKPAYEPIVLARKPLIGTVAANVLQYGTGAINVDGCRIGERDDSLMYVQPRATTDAGSASWSKGDHVPFHYGASGGRWPANVLMDEEAAAILDAQVGERPGGGSVSGGYERDSMYAARAVQPFGGMNDTGGPSRFFYTAKASRSEREAGVEVEPARRSDGRDSDIENPRLRTNVRRNDHPTVKPVDLMRWLCRLVTPPGGTVLDPFNGSGTTGMGALDEGFTYIGIEREPRYIEIAKHRITHRHLLEVAPVEANEEAPQGRLL